MTTKQKFSGDQLFNIAIYIIAIFIIAIILYPLIFVVRSYQNPEWGGMVIAERIYTGRL